MLKYLSRARCYPPEITASYFVRPHLIERLQPLATSPFTLIVAPAGYGKSISMAHVLAKSNRPFAWYEIRRQDDAPALFWAYVMTALRQLFPGWGKSLLQAIDNETIDLKAAESWHEKFGEQLKSLTRPVTLVLDDYHHISHADIQVAIQLLVMKPVPNLHLVILTRNRPPHIQSLSEKAPIYLTEKNLRFTPEETATYFRQHLNLDISPTVLNGINTVSGGRIMSLQLIGLLMQHDLSGAESLLQNFPAEISIFDYFAGQMVENLPPQVKKFLLYTGTLGTFSPELSNHVLNIQNSETLIQQIEQQDLFMVRVGEHQYRYHDLFTAFLQTNLPETERKHIHTLAAQWYVAQGILEKAADHALETQDFVVLIPIIKKATYDLLNKRTFDPILKWFNRVPDSMMQDNEELLLLRAWLTFLQGNPSQAKHYLQQIEPGHEQSVLYGIIHYIEGEYKTAITTLSAVLPHIQTFVPEVQLCLIMSLAGSRTLAGEWRAARDILIAFQDVAWGKKKGFIHALVLRWLTHLFIKTGQMNRAQSLIDRFFQQAQWQRFKGLMLIEQGIIRFYEYHLDEAAQQLEEGIQNLHAVHLYDHALVGQLWLIQLLVYSEQTEKARVDATGLAYIADRQMQVWYKQYVKDINAVIDYHVGDRKAVAAWANQYPDGIPLHSPALLTYLRYQADTSPQALAILNGYRARLMQQELSTPQIDVELILARLLLEKKQGNAAREHILKAVLLAFQGNYVLPFVREADWLVEHLHELNHIAPHFINHVLKVIADRKLTFTAREKEIIPLVVRGYTNKEIAAEIHVSVDTVKYYLKQLYKKLGVNNRTQAAQKLVDLKRA